MSSPIRRRAGFSLAELLVSLAILGMVTAYLTNMLVRQGDAYEVVDQTTEMQQNLRVLANVLDREIRMTGAMVPEVTSFCGFDNQLDSDVIFLSDVDAITMTAEESRDFVAVARPDETNGGTFTGTETGTLTVRLRDLVLDGDPAYDVDVPPDGVRESDFRIGAGVLFADFDNPDRGTACGLITDIVKATNTLVVNWRPFGQDSQLDPAPLTGSVDLVAVPANAYWIDDNAPNGPPQLIRNGAVLAEDVEDLQFAVFVDSAPQDGQVDLLVNEYPGANSQPAYDSQGLNHRALREIRLNFVLRSRFPDAEFGGPNNPGGLFQAMENRLFVGTGDQFRRRVYTAEIRPRNVGDRAGQGGDV
jgi:prepilin-type N-terminal cleavage/methylation domain-containing protein